MIQTRIMVGVEWRFGTRFEMLERGVLGQEDSRLERCSGEVYWRRTKSTVENSLVISMKDLRTYIVPNYSGVISWNSSNGKRSSAGFLVNLDDHVSILTVDYQVGGKEDIRIPVRLQSTPMRFTGIRWWFTCPLVVNGVACSRRVAKLYLPPGAKYFGCRHCHDLTYRSSQEAHYDEQRQEFLGSLIEKYGIKYLDRRTFRI